ncbi:hypothetical protein B9479_001377 [Cryptococcus floricola]|uniref:Reverse transcriptase RNase H-like domain-containing protein n=1 Tax=Cryptococcus floricola TaxID=2591691 RepID=A0A5D3B4W9_9TREE|nr:hypothetical protein B9479_001377 [Cryptococcus floricola]
MPFLTPLDFKAITAGETNLYLHTDASNTGIGAWLGSGPTLEEAAPITYDSYALLPADKNYPVHEKELLAIIHALKHWRSLLLGLPIKVLTDHATLQWFFEQPTRNNGYLSWQITTFASPISLASLNSLSLITTTVNDDFLESMANGYKDDTIMGRWLNEEECLPGIEMVIVVGKRGKMVELMKWEERNWVQEIEGLREEYLKECHDVVGHFGVEQTMETIMEKYFWLQMKKV